MGNADLPVGSGEDHAAALAHAGWTRQKRRGRGTHILLKKAGVSFLISIPNHREVKRALLGKLLRQIKMTEAEYVEHWRNR